MRDTFASSKSSSSMVKERQWRSRPKRKTILHNRASTNPRPPNDIASLRMHNPMYWCPRGPNNRLFVKCHLPTLKTQGLPTPCTPQLHSLDFSKDEGSPGV